MTQATINLLASKLTQESETPLTRDDRQLIVSALTSLAASQGVIERQVRLLKSYQHDVDSIDATAAESITRWTSRQHAPPASASYDLAKARAARETLLAEIQHAASLESAIATILRFAATIATVAA